MCELFTVQLVIALAVSLCLTACSGWVSQSEYDALNQKYDELQSEYNTLKEDSARIEQENEELKKAEKYMPNNYSYSPYGSILSDFGLTLPIGADKDDVISAIGGPDNTDDGWNFWNDEDGNLALCIIFDKSNKANTISVLDTTEHYYVFGVGIGSSRTDLESSWGTPDEERNGELYYYIDANGFQTDYVPNTDYLAVFGFSDGRITNIGFITRDNYLFEQ